MLNDLKRGELIVFAAPSGAGKSSLIKEIVSNNENIELSVSATTRIPREGETHGKDYFFISDKEFNDLKERFSKKNLNLIWEKYKEERKTISSEDD